MRGRALQLLLLVMCILQLVACIETIETSYTTFAEAESKGAIAAGWVPVWLPPAATNIREAHNIDTNRFMLSFSVSEGMQLSLPTDCARVEPRSPAKQPFNRLWWPDDVPANSLSTHRYAFSACQGYFVAYSSSLGQGYVWSRK